MPGSPFDPAERERRLDEVLGGYLAAAAAGRGPDRPELIAAHPDLAGELAAFFADYDRFHRLADPLRPVAQAARAADPGTEPTPESTATDALAGPGAGAAPTATLAADRPAAEPTAEPASDGIQPEGDAVALPRGTAVRYFGDYELRGVLGKGGMGVVYRAKQLSLNRPVALKMIKAGVWASDDEVRRFRNEAEAVANLDHPGIVTIHEVGRHDGRHYFSMRLIEGPSLDQRLDQYAADPRKAAHLVSEVARAVHHAHQRGILHRDLKPSNILLDGEGHPHVTDFGLAKRLEGNSSLSLSGSIVGTPQYMSPEQASGSKRAITTATDVYGLGALLYAALTGQPPFQSDSVLETLEQVRGRAPESPSKVNPRVPRDLEHICLRCLEKDPHRRYTSAEALAEDLRRFLAGEPIQARPAGRLERAVLWARRRPTAAALLAVSALTAMALVGGVVGLWLHLQLQDAHRRTRYALQAESTALASEKTQLYFNRILLAEREWRGNNVVRARQLLDECPRESRAWEWQYLTNRDRAELATFRTDPESWVMGLSPDGTRVIVGRRDARVEIRDAETWGVVRTFQGLSRSAIPFEGIQAEYSQAVLSQDGALLVTSLWRGSDLPAEVKLWDAAAGREIRALEGIDGEVVGVALSPDGSLLATGIDERGMHHGRVILWDAAAGRPIRSLDKHTGWISGLDFSPDGHRLAVACWAVGAGRMDNPGDLTLWDVETGQALRSWTGLTHWVISTAFAPDGRRIASGDADGTVHLWDAMTGQEVHKLIGHTDDVSVRFSPDGRTLASYSADGTIRLWDVGSGREILKLRGHSESIIYLAFHRDRPRLVSSSWSGTVKLWDFATNPEALTLLGHPTEIGCVTFSPDGRQLASIDQGGTLKVWDPSTGQELFTRHGYSFGGPEGLAFRPDGSALAAIGRDGSVCHVDPATGRRLQTYRGHRTRPKSVAFSPDGHRLASVSPGERPPDPGEIKVWDVASGAELFSLPGHPTESPNEPGSIGFSPDGRLLVTACGDHAIHVYDLATHRRVLRLAGHTGVVHAAAIHPDGRTIASAGHDNTVRLWDVTTGAELRVLQGHSREAMNAAFSPDGRRLVSGAIDRTLKLWDVESGQEILTLLGHAGGVSCVAFSPDGRRIVSGGMDGVVKVWEATPLAPEQRARREAAALVNRLGGEPRLREEVLDAIRSDPSLDEPVRQAALAMADRLCGDPERFFGPAMEVITRPGADADAYRLALRRAKAAAALDPDNVAYATMVGMGHYRLGAHARAVELLEPADTALVARKIPGGGAPWNLAFLAMSYRKLGQDEKAAATLARLRECLRHPQWSRVALYQAMLREAEALIELDPNFPADPFAP
jgi:WD40 repeat protein